MNEVVTSWDWTFWSTYIKEVKPLGKSCRVRPTPSSVRRDTSPAFLHPLSATCARLDLHGLTCEKAFELFCACTEQAVQQGYRQMIVITGKGGASGQGVLRRELPFWTHHPRVRGWIRSCAPAPSHQGGSGAFVLTLESL